MKTTAIQLKRLNTPAKIQDYLNKLPFNHESDGETCRSPKRVLKDRTAHCLEGALLAAAALWQHGARPLLLDLKADDPDFDHVVALFKKGKSWGAISKTNHGVLRYREPVYQTLRELALSYFHEYFLPNGQKTLRSFSAVPFDAGFHFGRTWIESDEDLWPLAERLDNARHELIASAAVRRTFRRADPIEIAIGERVEWPAPRLVRRPAKPKPLAKRPIRRRQ